MLWRTHSGGVASYIVGLPPSIFFSIWSLFAFSLSSLLTDEATFWPGLLSPGFEWCLGFALLNQSCPGACPWNTERFRQMGLPTHILRAITMSAYSKSYALVEVLSVLLQQILTSYLTEEDLDAILGSLSVGLGVFSISQKGGSSSRLSVM